MLKEEAGKEGGLRLHMRKAEARPGSSTFDDPGERPVPPKIDGRTSGKRPLSEGL